jgi:GT2 family glycosyltransferase
VVLEPLVRFCRAPGRDATKAAFAMRRPIVATPLAPPHPVRAAPVVHVGGSSRRIRDVAVLIATCNGLEHLEECLSALREQEDPGVSWRIIVHDNGSTDGTERWIRTRHPEVRLIRSAANIGFSPANNRMAELSGADAVAFLNDDTRPRPGWLRALVEALDGAPPDVAAVAGLIVDWSGSRLDFGQGILVFDGHAFQLDYHRPLTRARIPASGAELPFACGANCLIRRAVFTAVGGFDDDFFAYMEDVDLGRRLWLTGHRILSAPDAVVAHRSGGTGTRLPDALRGSLIERNAFLTAYKNYERGLLEELLPSILLTMLTRAHRLLADGGFRGATDERRFAPQRLNGSGTWERAVASLRPWARRLERVSRGVLPGPHAHVDLADPRLGAHYRALGLLLPGLEDAQRKRRAVQALRTRSDREYFERFPLHVVPTYPGDDDLFASPAFESWLPSDLTLIRLPLSEVGEL